MKVRKRKKNGLVKVRKELEGGNDKGRKTAGRNRKEE